MILFEEIIYMEHSLTMRPIPIQIQRCLNDVETNCKVERLNLRPCPPNGQTRYELLS